MSDDAVIRLIAEDRIDLLVDLSGHFENNRIRIFARRAAPRQLTRTAYVATTGLCSMDAIIADRFHIPPGDERFYRERVLRLPHGFICYTPPRETPAVTPPPSHRADHVTFGCFGNPAKINAGVLDVWAKILKPTSEDLRNAVIFEVRAAAFRAGMKPHLSDGLTTAAFEMVDRHFLRNVQTREEVRTVERIRGHLT